MKRFGLYLLIAVLIHPAPAQDISLSALKDSVRVYTYKDQARALSFVDTYIARCRMEDPARLSNALFWKAWIYDKHNEPVQAFRAYIETANSYLAEDSIAAYANIMELTGTVFYDAHYYQGAMEYFQRSHQAHMIAGKPYNVHENKREIGRCYYFLGDYKKATEYLTEALLYFIEERNSDRVATIYTDLGLIYHHTGDYQQAREHYAKSIIHGYHTKDSVLHRAKALTNTGWSYMYEKDFETADSLLLRSLEDKKKLDRDHLYVTTYSFLGKSKFLQGQFRTALNYFEKSLSHNADNLDPEEMRESANHLISWYEDNSMLDSAVFYLKKMNAILAKSDFREKALKQADIVVELERSKSEIEKRELQAAKKEEREDLIAVIVLLLIGLGTMGIIAFKFRRPISRGRDKILSRFTGIEKDQLDAVMYENEQLRKTLKQYRGADKQEPFSVVFNRSKDILN